MATEKNKQQILDQLATAIESLRFGSIEITLHDGRVTQIEKREKVRFSESQDKTQSSPTPPVEAKNQSY